MQKIKYKILILLLVNSLMLCSSDLKVNPKIVVVDSTTIELNLEIRGKDLYVPASNFIFNFSNYHYYPTFKTSDLYLNWLFLFTHKSVNYYESYTLGESDYYSEKFPRFIKINENGTFIKYIVSFDKKPVNILDNLEEIKFNLIIPYSYSNCFSQLSDKMNLIESDYLILKDSINFNISIMSSEMKGYRFDSPSDEMKGNLKYYSYYDGNKTNIEIDEETNTILKFIFTYNKFFEFDVGDIIDDKNVLD